MFLSNALVAATLLASTTTAFYPWNPTWRCVEDNSCVAERSTEDVAEDTSLKLIQRIPKVDLSRNAYCSG